jgi:hypothetical protein
LFDIFHLTSAARGYRGTRLSLIFATAALLALSACGGGTNPTVGVQPTPSPTATPAVPDLRLSASCARLRQGSPTAECHADVPSVFYGDVQSALLQVRAERPELFSGTRALSLGQVAFAVVAALDAKGLCTVVDSWGVGVTRDGSVSEYFSLFGTGDRPNVRVGEYPQICRPSTVPPVLPPITVRDASCRRLAPSREALCAKDASSIHVNDVEAAVESVIARFPQYFDDPDFSLVPGAPRVLNLEGFASALAAELMSRGFCALYVNGELEVKQSNERSEHFVLVSANSYVLRGQSLYKTSCYPAAF